LANKLPNVKPTKSEKTGLKNKLKSFGFKDSDLAFVDESLDREAIALQVIELQRKATKAK
jgi:hypothetical protein